MSVQAHVAEWPIPAHVLMVTEAFPFCSALIIAALIPFPFLSGIELLIQFSS